MLFRNNKKLELATFLIMIILIGGSLFLDMFVLTLLWFVTPLVHLRHLLDSYEVEENVITLKKPFKAKKVPLNSVKHLRRLYGIAEESIEDRSATYLIPAGKRYEVLNKFAKNSDGRSIVDVLLDDYKIPLVNEQTKFFTSVKVK